MSESLSGFNLSVWEDLHKYLEKEHPCIVCGGSELEEFAREEYLIAKKCRKCGMVSNNPHFSDEGLTRFYQTYFSSRQENLDLKAQRDITYQIDHDWITSIVPEGDVLDIGCSGGFFLDKFSSEKFNRSGVEIGTDAAEFAKKNFGLDVRVGYIGSMEFDKKYDLVMMRGVIEHFRDPIEVLEKCSEILKPGGTLFITATPAGDAFAFDVYREKWRLYTPLEHIHFFTLQNLNDVVKKYGLDYHMHNFQYTETPYANSEKDFATIRKDIVLLSKGKKSEVGMSVAFPGSMLTAAWKKQ